MFSDTYCKTHHLVKQMKKNHSEEITTYQAISPKSSKNCVCWQKIPNFHFYYHYLVIWTSAFQNRRQFFCEKIFPWFFLVTIITGGLLERILICPLGLIVNNTCVWQIGMGGRDTSGNLIDFFPMISSLKKNPQVSSKGGWISNLGKPKGFEVFGSAE